MKTYENKYLDTRWPTIITPRLLESTDKYIQSLFRNDLRRHQPNLYEWAWIQGTELPINSGEPDEYWDKANWWINKKYPLGTFSFDETKFPGVHIEDLRID